MVFSPGVVAAWTAVSPVEDAPELRPLPAKTGESCREVG